MDSRQPCWSLGEFGFALLAGTIEHRRVVSPASLLARANASNIHSALEQVSGVDLDGIAKLAGLSHSVFVNENPDNAASNLRRKAVAASFLRPLQNCYYHSTGSKGFSRMQVPQLEAPLSGVATSSWFLLRCTLSVPGCTAHALHRALTTAIPETDLAGDVHALVFTCSNMHHQATFVLASFVASCSSRTPSASFKRGYCGQFQVFLSASLTCVSMFAGSLHSRSVEYVVERSSARKVHFVVWRCIAHRGQATLQATLRDKLEHLQVLHSPADPATVQRNRSMAEKLLCRAEHSDLDRLQDKLDALMRIFNGDWRCEYPIHHCEPGVCTCENAAASKQLAFASLLECGALLGTDVQIPSINRWGTVTRSAGLVALFSILHNVLPASVATAFHNWRNCLPRADGEEEDDYRAISRSKVPWNPSA